MRKLKPNVKEYVSMIVTGATTRMILDLEVNVILDLGVSVDVRLSFGTEFTDAENFSLVARVSNSMTQLATVKKFAKKLWGVLKLMFEIKCLI